MEKKVSIITPCYNGEKYVRRHLEAVLNQSYDNIEMILVNDGSIDKTEEIVESYMEKFKNRGYIFKHIYQENSGQAEAINKALKLVGGEFLYWMDVDDYCEPNTIENFIRFFKNNPSYNIARGKVRKLKDNVEIGIGKPQKGESEYIFENYIFGINSYCFPGTFMIRMSDFDKKVKNRTIYNSRAGQNWQLLLPMLYNQKCGFINEIVYNYNIIENSHSRAKMNTFKEEIEKKDGYMDLLKSVLIEMGVYDNYAEKIRLHYDKNKIKIAAKYDEYQYIINILDLEKKECKNYKLNKKYWILKNKIFYKLYRKIKAESNQ